MNRKNARIVIFIAGTLLLIWGMVIYPILNRGTISVTINNNRDEIIYVDRINDHVVGMSLNPYGSLTVKYVIPKEESLCAYLSDASKNPMETQLLAEYITPQNYGRANLNVKVKSGKITFSIWTNIS